MVMKLIIVPISLLFITIFLSCRKENMVVTEKTDIPLLSKVQVADKPFYEYFYTGAKLTIHMMGKLTLLERHCIL
jgi:hypothetical protein